MGVACGSPIQTPRVQLILALFSYIWCWWLGSLHEVCLALGAERPEEGSCSQPLPNLIFPN